MSLIVLDIQDRIATITLNNDSKRNALSSALIAEAISAFTDCAARKVRVAILRANHGAKVWSAGHDVNELPRSGRDPLAYNDPLERLIRAVREFKAPVIGMVEGGVWGGACELVVACDIPIASPTATFAITPARIGVPYNPAGLLRLMNECDASVLKEMLFPAQPISAARALAVGMLNHVVPAEKIEHFTTEIATSIAALAPLSISVIKEQIRLLSNARPLAPETFERIQGLRQVVYESDDYREGITAFLERRPPQWTGK
jgi:methylmalonyl-CoA decarboxylase